MGKHLTIDEVKSRSIRFGFEFKDDYYVGNAFLHNFFCIKHEQLQLSRLNAISAGVGLACCRKEKISKLSLLPEEVVKSRLLEKGFFLLEKYTLSRSPHKMLCLEHQEEHYSNIDNIVNKTHGLKCCFKARSSASHIEYYKKHPEARVLISEQNLEKMKNGIFKQTKTAPHRKIIKLLESLGIKHETEKTIGYFSIDEFIPSMNLCIEIQGDYWHCNPVKYPNGPINKMQRTSILRDFAKKNTLKNAATS